MNVRMSQLTLVTTLLSLLSVYAQDISFGDDEIRPIKPLPRADPAVIKKFSFALEAINGMGIRLQALLEEEGDGENFLVSPLSAATVVAQLVLGADGVFQKQLVDLLSLSGAEMYESSNVQYYGKVNGSYSLPYDLLHLQLSSLLKELESSNAAKNFILLEKSAAFVKKRISLKEEFKKHLQRFYGTRIYKVNFKKAAAQRIINNWAQNQTNGLIEKLLPHPPSSETTAIFANAVYFKADWEYPFSDILNRKGPFTVNENKKVEATYMISSMEDIIYSESAHYRLIALPYKNEDLGFYIILPKADHPHKYNIKAFIRTLKASETLKTIDSAKRKDVIVKIPKLSIKNTFSILKELKKYQVYKNQNADKVNTSSNSLDQVGDKVNIFNNFTTNDEQDIYLSNAADQTIRIDDIVQQAVITVNEKGTEAAAISASTIDYIGGQKSFMVDRPFVFFIRHEATSATLFWGSVGNPAA